MWSIWRENLKNNFIKFLEINLIRIFFENYSVDLERKVLGLGVKVTEWNANYSLNEMEFPPRSQLSNDLATGFGKKKMWKNWKMNCTHFGLFDFCRTAPAGLEPMILTNYGHSRWPGPRDISSGPTGCSWPCLMDTFQFSLSLRQNIWFFVWFSRSTLSKLTIFF